jgi:hypothetical protein
MGAVGALGAVLIKPPDGSMRQEVLWFVDDPGVVPSVCDDLLGISSQIP